MIRRWGHLDGKVRAGCRNTAYAYYALELPFTFAAIVYQPHGKFALKLKSAGFWHS